MEFVLVTTTSTPDTSRSGSIMKFGDYREDDQNVAETIDIPLEEEFLQFEADSDDEDKNLLEGFNALSARNRLVCYDHCIKVVLDHELQKALQLEVGVHVSEENPWKQIRKEILMDYLPIEGQATAEINELRLRLNNLNDDAPVLVGFAAAITDIEDTSTFLFYVDQEAAKESVSLIQRLEAFERQRVNKNIFKYPRPWKSLGSENEVDLQIEVKRKDKTEVEIQRLFDKSRAPVSLSFRFAEDIRDGYVELVPKNKNDTDVIMRRKVSAAVQSAVFRVESEQQTDPTFPANAWSQYSYELPVNPNQPEEKSEDNYGTEVNESCSEAEADEEAEEDQDVIGPSDAMKELLRVLEFNAIDMYRDDYTQISSTAVKQYTKPSIKESFCFIDPQRCSDRFVSGFAWHPTLSGVFVASYCFNTLNTFSQDEKNTIEEVNRKLIMKSNPVLLWSFNDTLYPKLVLETPREVTYLSFCPYDPNVLIGGLISGQLIIWDLINCLHRVEHSVELSNKQAKNREKLYSLMSWSKFVENLQPNVVHPAAISNYELSQKKRITSIKWMNRKQNIAGSGLIQESIKPNEFFRHFVTASLDGTVAFWDLDFAHADLNSKEIKRADTKRKLSIRIVPEQTASPYGKLNGVFYPIYAVTCEQPISNLIFDEVLLRYEPLAKVEGTEINKRIEFKVIHEQQEKASNRLLVSSLLGTMSTFIWEGFLYKEGKPEKAKQIETFATIHNGPVQMIERNPFMPGVILSIGKSIFAIWSENNQSTPILWRRRETNITCAAWSPTRMSLFFIACYQGIIELWDLTSRTDIPCISYKTGATIITIISQHRLALPTDILLISDQKSNIRAFTLPPILSQPKSDDSNKFKDFIENELNRKQKFDEWQQKYLETNEDLEEAKQLIREESRKTIETSMPQPIEKDFKSKDEKRQSTTGARSKSISKPTKSKLTCEYTERMRRKWEEKQMKRQMKALLTLKRFDLEKIAQHIKPEKDRIAYNRAKKRAIEENFQKVHHEISEIRARLLPQKDVDQEAERLDFIKNNVDNLLSSDLDGFRYDLIETELKEKLAASEEKDIVQIEWHELLGRTQEKRWKAIQSLFEQKRKAFIEKSVGISEQNTDDGAAATSVNERK